MAHLPHVKKQKNQLINGLKIAGGSTINAYGRAIKSTAASA
jgi:hypothetical protein